MHSQKAMDTNESTNYRPMQAVKRHFFAMRNGVIADVLRKGGSPYRFIFGLNLPQLTEAAAMFGSDKELAEELWANTNTRESMLLAPMLMPREEFSLDDARRWTANVPAVEAADILCLKLLRHMPYAPEFALELAADGHSDMHGYLAGRLAINLMYSNREAADAVLKALQHADTDKYPLSHSICRQLEERLDDKDL